MDCNGDGELDAADIKVMSPPMAPNARCPLWPRWSGALSVLDSDPDGLADGEGGASTGLPSNQLGRVVEEVIDFSKAVEAVWPGSGGQQLERDRADRHRRP